MSWSGKPHFIKAGPDPRVQAPEAKSMTESKGNLCTRLQGMHTQPEAGGDAAGQRHPTKAASQSGWMGSSVLGTRGTRGSEAGAQMMCDLRGHTVNDRKKLLFIFPIVFVFHGAQTPIKASWYCCGKCGAVRLFV